jgi:nucleoside-diphosphate-sugar epimerase
MCQLVNEFRALTGRAPRVLAVSAETAKAWARVGRWYLEKLAPDLDEILSTSGISYFSRDVYYDISRAKSELNYSPDFTLKRGLEMCWRYRQSMAHSSLQWSPRKSAHSTSLVNNKTKFHY